MISIEELRLACRITGSSRDGELLEIEQEAVAYVQKTTGRFFGDSESVTEYIEGDDRQSLWLAEVPATVPTTVIEHTWPGDTGTTITQTASDGYILRGARTARLIRKAGLAWSRGLEYEVTYTRGFATGEEPADIRRAVKQLVVWWFERRIPMTRAGEMALGELPHHLVQTIRNWQRIHV